MVTVPSHLSKMLYRKNEAFSIVFVRQTMDVQVVRPYSEEVLVRVESDVDSKVQAGRGGI